MSENNTIGLGTVIQRNEIRFIANKLGDEMVMMDMDSGDFISMNNVGADIWSLSGEPLSVHDLTVRLMKLYNIGQEQCTNETIAFLQASRAQNLFIIHDAIRA